MRNNEKSGASKFLAIAVPLAAIGIVYAVPALRKRAKNLGRKMGDFGRDVLETGKEEGVLAAARHASEGVREAAETLRGSRY